MKLIYLILIHLALLPVLHAATPVTTETFKSITNPYERRKMIMQAPPEQQLELAEIDNHLNLLQRWKGESGLKAHRENIAAQQRGLGALAGLVFMELQAWDLNIGAKGYADKVAGVAPDQIKRSLAELNEQRAVIEKRQATMHGRVFNLAPTPQALALNQRAQAIVDRLNGWMERSAQHFPLTKTQRDNIDSEIEAIANESATLPAIAPEQAQKEYEACSEDKIYVDIGID